MPARRTTGDLLSRTTKALNRARSRQRITGPRRLLGRSATTLLCLLAGLMVVVGALNARGTDLRPARNTDLVSLVQDQSRRNADLAREVTSLRREVDQLTGQGSADNSDRAAEVVRQSDIAGIRSVIGPAVSVTLDDAPESVSPEGVDGDLLVVHQQDIQAIVNILWRSGAEAMTIQGQRVISTTGIKCVGNTVVLHGIPYAPPYVIRAIGDRERLETGLAESEFVQVFQRYVDAYGLVYQTGFEAEATFPAYSGSMELRHAQSVGRRETPGRR